MDDFKESHPITIDPGDSNVPYSFIFNPCSGQDSNDGAIPFGTTVLTGAVTAKNETSGADATSALISGSAVNPDRLIVRLKYPGANGTYSLRFVLTLSSGAVIEFDFKRIIAKD